MKHFPLVLVVGVGAITDTMQNVAFWFIGILYTLTLIALDKERAGIHGKNLITSSHSDRVYRIGIVVGSAAGLGEIYKIDPSTANDISRIVSAPIAMDSSKLLTEIATFG